MLNFTQTYLYIVFLLLIPALSCVNAILLKKFIKIRECIFFLISTLPIFFLLSLMKDKRFWNMTFVCMRPIVSNVYFLLKSSNISNIFVILICILYPITTIYSIAYLHLTQDKNRGRFHFFVSCAVVSTICFAYSGNLFTSFVFYDILTVGTYFLVLHNHTEQAKRGALQYMLYLIIPSIALLLPAIIEVYDISGTTDFKSGGILHLIPLSKLWINLLYGMFVFGTAKSAIIVMHRWLVFAMVAPVPVSGLLHAVLVVKSGVFLLMQITINIFGIEFLKENILTIYNISWPIYIAIFTLLFGSFSAISADNLKKRLAYSTISQISYILLSIFYFSKKAIYAGMIHFVAHSFAKLNIFFYVGILHTKYKISYISDLIKSTQKVGFVMMISLLLCIFSIIGLPPTLGFTSKYNLILSLLNNQNDLIIFIAFLISAITTVIYLMPFFYHIISFEDNQKLVTQKLVNPNENRFINALLEISIIISPIVLLLLFFLINMNYIPMQLNVSKLL
jgi:multicomponent Na+:H+ antiporter subunit D